MIDLKHLNMDKCCSLIHDENRTLFRDLISVETLDISSTKWSSLDPYFLYSMKNLKHIMMRNFMLSESEPYESRNTHYSSYNYGPRTYVSKNGIDFSTILRKQRVLETVDMSSLRGSLDPSKFKFSSPKIRRLSLRNNRLTNFNEMKTSFGLPNPAALKELVLSGCNLIVVDW